MLINIRKCISLLWLYILFVVLAFSNFNIHMYLNTINYALLYDFRIFVYAKKSNSNANYCLLCLPHICTTWAQRRQFSIFTAWRTLLSSASQKLFLSLICWLSLCLRRCLCISVPAMPLPASSAWFAAGSAREPGALALSQVKHTHTARERDAYRDACVCVCVFICNVVHM